jgi:predicted negative regulator of RcsB-dependent stress response
MELHEAPAKYFFKLWPWIEANKIRLIFGGSIVVIAIILISYRSYHKEQKEFDAGMKLTETMMNAPRNITIDQQAGLFLKVAGDYSGTVAGQRALLQSAAMLYEAQKYPEAQARFQQFLSQYTSSSLAAQAALGAAACLDAQGKTDPADAAYRQIISSYSDSSVTIYAKFRLAQIDEQKGKATEALNFYEDIAHSSPNTSVGMEAGLRAMELKGPTAATAKTPTPATAPKPNL